MSLRKKTYRVLFNSLCRVKGNHTPENYKFLLESQWYSEEELKRIQNKN